MNKKDRKIIKIALITVGVIFIISLLSVRLFRESLEIPHPTIFHDIQCRVFAGGYARWGTIPVGLVPDYVSACYADYAYKFMNVEFCDRANLYNQCYFDVATNKSKPELCEKIELNRLKENCLKLVNEGGYFEKIKQR